MKLQSLSNVMCRIARALINAVGEGKIMKVIRKAPVTFRYMELRQNQERGSTCVCERLERPVTFECLFRMR